MPAGPRTVHSPHARRRSRRTRLSRCASFAGTRAPVPTPLYHLLDPLWSRVRLPYVSRFAVSRFASLSVVRMARAYFGRELPPVYCYLAGDTLVDTGLAS